ncbi:hypothetical protein AB1Y20_017907 [Prymnesium parvum]|uniref:Fe2OG dioxygenase domain-containing protein n=1 Tax=Prymnesium parvum TaxID=97485 RepID=A0AB34JPG7_PRYPA
MAVAVLHTALLLLLPARELRPGLSGTARSFDQDGFVYIPSLLPSDAFDKVQRECRSYRSRLKPERNSIANGRLGHVLDSRSVAHQTFLTDTMSKRLQSLLGMDDPFVPSEFPIELRHYPHSSGMQWHQDDMLYTQPQCEFVFTVDNDSDSFTEWIDAQNCTSSVWTVPNSLLAIRAGATGPTHRVTPVTRGQRTILKFVYTTGGEKLPDFYAHIDSFPGHRASTKQSTRRQRAKWGR